MSDDREKRHPAGEDEIGAGERATDPGSGSSAKDGAPEVPAPATWAGRRGGAGDELDQGPLEEEEELHEGAPVDEGLDEGEPHDEAEHEEGEPEGNQEAFEELDEEEGEPEDHREDFEEELDEEELEEEELAVELAGDGRPEAPAPADETVEADTLGLGDREAARERALAGLRARAAQHAAKGGTGAVTPPAPPPPVAEPEPEVAAEAEQAPPAEQEPPATEAQPPEGPPRRGLWARFLAGSLLIMVSMATATAVSLLVYLTDLARGLGGLPSVRNQLEVADPGSPQTILILGSDERPAEKALGARSDTTILLRVAPSQITVMSIPRDLKVNIPGHGIDRFNAAYAYGGPKLTLKVVKQLTGLDNVNHVVNVDFNGFADAVNAVDCVYVDVDHHYYHSNLGLASSEQYAEIDVPAGYQRMCGFNALQYVRYRHDDNDLVRAARQQEFLREARQELPPSKLLSDRNDLTDILKQYVTSDIDKETTLIGLGKLFIAARNAPVVQVDFPANLGGPNASYVTASESAIKDAVGKFEGETPALPPEAQNGSNERSGGKKKSSKEKKPPPPPLIDASASAQQYAANLTATKTKAGKPMIDFPIYFPTKLAPNSTITDDSRAFPIDGPGNDVYHGYKLVVAMPTLGYTAYYGVSGTDWKDPPILSNPDETKPIDGRDYLLSWDGGRLRFVGWKTDHGSYWIDNTLLNVLAPGQMLAIAESMRNNGR